MANKVLDKAIRTMDARVCDEASASDYADYLWRWTKGEIASDLIGSLVREAPFEAKPENRDKAYKWAAEKAKKELDKFYSKLQDEVRKRLKEGYTASYQKIVSYTK